MRNLIGHLIDWTEDAVQALEDPEARPAGFSGPYHAVSEQVTMSREAGSYVYHLADDQLGHGASLGNAQAWVQTKGRGEMVNFFSLETATRVMGGLAVNYLMPFSNLTVAGVAPEGQVGQTHHYAPARPTVPGTVHLHPAVKVIGSANRHAIKPLAQVRQRVKVEQLLGQVERLRIEQRAEPRVVGVGLPPLEHRHLLRPAVVAAGVERTAAAAVRNPLQARVAERQRQPVGELPAVVAVEEPVVVEHHHRIMLQPLAGVQRCPGVLLPHPQCGGVADLRVNGTPARCEKVERVAQDQHVLPMGGGADPRIVMFLEDLAACVAEVAVLVRENQPVLAGEVALLFACEVEVG